MDLRNHKDWDNTNGTLSVTMNPKIDENDSRLYVLLNGSAGNFCLDYTEDAFDKKIANERAWSSDTGYYVKISQNNNVVISRWWDSYVEEIPFSKVEEKPQRFYEAIIKNSQKQTNGIVSFAKETFIKLRNCIPQSDNGQISLRTFMYLLAALEENVETAQEIDKDKWKLEGFNNDWIAAHDWEWVYKAFKAGTNNTNLNMQLVLRHASNRLFQEAHREATRKEFQTALWGGTSRSYNSGISDGAFYTPTPLVRTIVQESLWSLGKAKELTERDSISILDPACGSAEFLREALRQLKINHYKGKVKITGWDISEIACEMSRFVLNYENNSEWAGEVEINIETKDSLNINWVNGNSFDMILMNPPFRAFENLGERKSIVLAQLGDLKTRQPDMAAVFLKKATEATADNGVLGLVMPHSLIGAETYKNLRNYIKEDIGMDFSLIARLGSAGLFEKAMIIPSVLVGVKKVKAFAHTILWTDHQQESVYTALRKLRIYRSKDIPTPIIQKEYSIYDNQLLTEADQNAWKVNSYQMYQLSERLKSFDTVGKLFNVKRGVDTGNNAAFLITKEEWLALPKKEQPYFRPCIMRNSITNGQLNDSLYLFYPYNSKQIITEEILEEKLPQYLKIRLVKHKDKLKERKGFENKWWELSRPRSFHDKPKLVSAYFGKAGYFAFDKSGKYLVGQSFAWLPKTKELDSEDYDFAYLALLHAPFVNKLLEMVCNVLEGGYFDLSKHYVDKMPLPDLSNADAGTLSYLTKIGKNIHEGKEFDQDGLNQVVLNAYGINLEQL
jgi:adenine-specific DNA-methyltransferase